MINLRYIVLRRVRIAFVVFLGLLLIFQLEVFRRTVLALSDNTTTSNIKEHLITRARFNKEKVHHKTAPASFVETFLNRPCNPKAADDLLSLEDSYDLQRHPALISHIHEHVLKRPVHRVSNNMTYETDERGEIVDPSPGQMMKKLIIPGFFSKMKKPGIFFEAGVLDGYSFSTTYYLEKILGWTGLIAEVSPLNDPYVNAMKHGRTAMTAAVCLSPHPWPCKGHYSVAHGADVKVSDLRGGPLPWLGGINSIPGVSARNQAFSDKLDTSQHIRTALNGARVYEAFVDCYPLGSLLLAANLTHVDFLSLDVEGIERQVLAAFPWTLIDVKVVRLDLFQELVHGTTSSLIELMAKHGYHFHEDLLKNRLVGEADSFVFSKDIQFTVEALIKLEQI